MNAGVVTVMPDIVVQNVEMKPNVTNPVTHSKRSSAEDGIVTLCTDVITVL